MDRAQVGVLEQADHIAFRRLLQRQHRRTLEPQVVLKGGRYVAHEPLKRQLADEELGRLLELADLAEGDGAGAEAVGPFDAAWFCCFVHLCQDVLPCRSLASGAFASCHLGPCHYSIKPD